MNPLSVSPRNDPKEPGARLVLISAVLLTVAGDFLLWPAPLGVSFGIFALLAGATLLGNREGSARGTGTVLAAVALLVASAWQSAVALSWSNILVVSVLILVLTGETSFRALPPGWPRWSEALWALGPQAPGRWLWFGRAAQQTPLDRGAAGALLQVLLPTVALGGVFVLLLLEGNAIFADGMTRLIDFIWPLLPSFDLSWERFFVLGLLATFSLALLRPAEAPEEPRAWTRRIPVLPVPRHLSIARWRSGSILILVNVLFFAANTIDVIFLWIEGTLPDGVTYSAFVHEGVFSLIAAVLLAALVIITIFQQDPEVTSSNWLKGLSLVWIAQNGALIASVFLRLKLYVDAYQLSELRVYVGFFLLLVSAGFLLLAGHVLRPGDLNRLLVRNGLATFALFFVLQFLDVGKWVADDNVSRWQSDRFRSLDVPYLLSLGPSAWPALIAAAETPERPESRMAAEAVRRLQISEHGRLTRGDWRSWQWRTVVNGRALWKGEVRPPITNNQ